MARERHFNLYAAGDLYSETRSPMLELRDPKPIRVIALQVTQPIRPRYMSAMDGRTDGRKEDGDRRTDNAR